MSGTRNVLEDLNELLSQLIKDKKYVYNYTQDYTSAEKELVAQRCYELGFKATFSETNESCDVTLTKRTKKLTFDLKLTDESLDVFKNFIAKNSSIPISKITEIKGSMQHIQLRKLNLHTSLCPPRIPADKISFETYSTYPYRKALVELITNNKVTIVIGKSGTGKTTQIPQYLLDELEEKSVNIVCVEPDHISTVVAAKSVAKQRGDVVGALVGYYLLMESVISVQTCLVYVNPEIFIQTLVTNSGILEEITYLIIDEIHLRNRYIDFILVAIKEYMNHHENLKIILMSATSHVDIYMKYFDCDSVIEIPSRSYPVQEYFVEDIVELIGYESKEMSALMRKYDSLILDCLKYGKRFAELHDLILCGDLNVNYQDEHYGYTPLMVSAAYGMDDLVEKYLELGASWRSECKKGYNAYAIASMHGKRRTADIIKSAMAENTKIARMRHRNIIAPLYRQTVSEDQIDFQLTFLLIEHIQKNSWDKLAVLVFLPTYDCIIDFYNFIDEQSVSGELKLITLHDGMSLQRDHDLFESSEQRMVILATDIAQSSFLIKDVGYVIDSGKATPSVTSAPSVGFKWISQMSAVHRKARASFQSSGRCFRLYSEQTYETFNFDNTAELLDARLLDMCLRANLIVPHLTIQQYFDKAVEPPSNAEVKTAVKALINLGLLDTNENVTILGLQTVQIFVDPQIAKMLFYGMFLKCLDPVLTIASVLVYQDPFIKSNDSKRSAMLQDMIVELSRSSCSDHVALLFAYQAWQKIRTVVERDVDKKHCLNEGVMENIIVIRANLLTQLRFTEFVTSGTRVNLPQLNKYSSSSAMVKAALASCLYPNVAMSMNDLFFTRNELVAVESPSCVIGSRISESLAVIYQEFRSSSDLPKIKYVTAVSPITIALFCGPRAEYEPTTKLMRLDRKINVQSHHHSVWKFRFLFDKLFAKYLSNPHKQWNGYEGELHDVLHDVLNREDAAFDLARPEGIGRKPIFVHMKSAEYQRLRQNDRYINDGTGNTPVPNKFNKNFNFKAFVKAAQNIETVKTYQGRYDSDSVEEERNFSHRSDVNSPIHTHRNDVNSAIHTQRRDAKAAQNIETLKGYHRGHDSDFVEEETNYTQRRDANSQIYTHRRDVNTFMRDAKAAQNIEALKGHHRRPDSDFVEEATNYTHRRDANPPIPTHKWDANTPIGGGNVIKNITSEYFAARENEEAWGVSVPEEDANKLREFSFSQWSAPRIRFFVIRPLQLKSIYISMGQGVWKFTAQTERKIFSAFANGDRVLLFYNVRGTVTFQSVAELKDMNHIPGQLYVPIAWIGIHQQVNYIDIPDLAAVAHNIIDDGHEFSFELGMTIYNMMITQLPVLGSRQAVLGRRQGY